MMEAERTFGNEEEIREKASGESVDYVVRGVISACNNIGAAA